MPSGTVVVSNETDHGAEVSVPRFVQELPPAGLMPKTTLVAPLPVVVADSVTVPERVAPGSSSETPGGVASTATVIDALW